MSTTTSYTTTTVGSPAGGVASGVYGALTVALLGAGALHAFKGSIMTLLGISHFAQYAAIPAWLFA